jgi:3-oxoacyl-[acyl-carrier protein] reductase
MKKFYILTGSNGSLGRIVKNYLIKKKINLLNIDINKTNNNNNCLDASKEKDVKFFFKKLENKKIYPEVLINSAGLFVNEPIITIKKGKLESHSLSSFKKIINSNLNTAFLMNVNYVRHMVANKKKGLIINFSSISAEGNVGQVAYSIAKCGIELLNKMIVKEVGQFGIRSVCIAPGFVNVESTKKLLSKNVFNTIINNTPSKRLVLVNNIVNTIFYIINNSNINGCTIKVDDGYTL